MTPPKRRTTRPEIEPQAIARIVAVERALSLLVHAARTSPPLRDAVATVEAEIRRLRAALREIRALHQPEWASEQARAAGKEPWVCALCGTADGHWPCDTTTTIREVLGDE